MSDAEKLRGFAAAVGQFRKGGRGGGGKRSPHGALNAAHIILAAAGEPLTSGQVVVHALGLGLWRSDAEHPRNGIAHVMDDSAKKPDGVIVKPGPGLYTVREGAPDPLPVKPGPVDSETAELYADMITDGELNAITI